MIKRNEEENQFVQNLINKINKEHELASNPDYINWLEKFTEKYPRFTDDDFLSDKKAKTIDDIEKMNSLGVFFQIIEKYAQKNYIYPIKKSEYSGVYKIKYNNVGYEIGVMIGQGTLFFCNRKNNVDNSYIDYNDILTNKKQPQTDSINKTLEQLNTIVASCYDQGIPLKALKKCLNDTIKQLSNEEKIEPKKLRKKI